MASRRPSELLRAARVLCLFQLVQPWHPARRSGSSPRPAYRSHLALHACLFQLAHPLHLVKPRDFRRQPAQLRLVKPRLLPALWPQRELEAEYFLDPRF